MSLLFFTLPGFLLFRVLDPKISPEKFPVYFVLTVSLYVPVFVLGFLLKLPVTTIFLMMGTVLTGSLVATYFRLQKNKAVTAKATPITTWIKHIVVVSFFVLTYLALAKYFPVFHGGDSQYHFAQVGNMISQERIVNEEAMVILENEEMINPGYKDNLWHAVWATISSLNNISAQKSATTLNPALFILSILAVAYLASALGGNKNTLIISGIFYLSSVYTFRPLDGMLMFYPNRIGYLIFLPVITGLFVQYLETKPGAKKYLYLGVGVISLIAAAMVHNMAFFYALITCGAYFALKALLTSKGRLDYLKQNIWFFLLSTVAVAPILLLKGREILEFSAYTATKEVISGATYITPTLFYYGLDLSKPSEYIFGIVLGLAALIYFLIKKTKLPNWTVLFLSSLLAILLLRENPLIAPLATTLVSGTYMRRMFYILPTVIVFTFAYELFVSSKIGAKRAYLLLLSALVIFVYSGATFSPETLDRYRENSNLFRNMSGVTAYINKSIPLKSRVATEISLGYELSGRSNVRVIAIPSSINALYTRESYPERKADLLTLFEPTKSGLNPDERVKIFNKYGAEYALVATRSSYLAYHAPKYDGPAVSKSLGQDKNFTLLYQDKYYSLYKFQPNSGPNN